MVRQSGMDLKVATDEELALAFKEGELTAFEELVRRHQGRVYAIAYRVTSNREDALDVAQEAFLKVYRKIGLWQPTTGFMPWLYRLTMNQAIDQTRRQKRQRHERLEDAQVSVGGGGKAEPSVEGTEAAVRSGEIDTRVRAALSVLSPAQKTVFVLRHYQGLALAEIAEAMGCTAGSVKVHLFRALRKLREALGDLRID
ncbi:MAG: sigma-70 family RNA polymerase sigma factor [Candidatus Hydrogenedentes bacterium]|nr:sigma-70 family RNA polymerase sigma factor [Candidatus Hydrogenedentota bacterium]